MFYIKLDENMDLVTTVREPLFRGDNLNRKLVYLTPLTVGDIDMLTAYVYLNYIRADGEPDVVVLERMEEKYNESYYQYTFPVTCRLTKYSGEVCTWMQIFTGTLSNPTIQKTGECTLHIQESKNIDDYLCDRQMTALYQLHAKLNEQDDRLDDVNEELATKADGLVYDSEEESLTLTSDGEEVGEPIDVSDMVNKDDVIHFDSGDTPADDPDAVIYF